MATKTTPKAKRAARPKQVSTPVTPVAQPTFAQKVWTGTKNFTNKVAPIVGSAALVATVQFFTKQQLESRFGDKK